MMKKNTATKQKMGIAQKAALNPSYSAQYFNS